MRRRRLHNVLGIAVAGLLIVATSMVTAESAEELTQGTVTSAGVFTDEQAERGEETYMQECAASVSYTHLTLPTNREV